MRHFICLSLLACAAAFAAAEDVALIGVIGDKAAVLALEGGEPKTVKVGQTWSGVTVIAVSREQATVEIDGKRRVLTLGQHYRNSAVVSSRESVTLSADSRGHFFAEAAVNDIPMRFVVDTGASAVVLSAADALRLGIDWRKGARRTMQTADGPTSGYLVKLDKLRLGGIELHDVDGVVVEHGAGVGLLGMSFLNRLDMRRDGDTMTLTRRF
ncbi:MAG: TIGR02281 family clan AA aspartic protease [Betaproteobacteria bacterium]|nr:MAG: TIGR02281 family clan AA aspartic protease [Betaproteobacteria bacterium]